MLMISLTVQASAAVVVTSFIRMTEYFPAKSHTQDNECIINITDTIRMH